MQSVRLTTLKPLQGTAALSDRSGCGDSLLRCTLWELYKYINLTNLMSFVVYLREKGKFTRTTFILFNDPKLAVIVFGLACEHVSLSPPCDMNVL